MTNRSADERFNAWKVGKCQYFCETKACKKTFVSSVAFWHHVLDTHRIPPAAYRRQHPDYCRHSEQIQCKMCGEFIVYDFAKLRKHMEKVHDRMRLRDYFDWLEDGEEEAAAIQYIEAAADDGMVDDAIEYETDEGTPKEADVSQLDWEALEEVGNEGKMESIAEEREMAAALRDEENAKTIDQNDADEATKIFHSHSNKAEESNSDLADDIVQTETATADTVKRNYMEDASRTVPHFEAVDDVSDDATDEMAESDGIVDSSDDEDEERETVLLCNPVAVMPAQVAADEDVTPAATVRLAHTVINAADAEEIAKVLVDMVKDSVEADDTTYANAEPAFMEDPSYTTENQDDWVYECPELQDNSILLQKPCQICHKAFSQLETLQYHVKTDHQLNMLQYYKIFFDINPLAWLDCCLFKCFECEVFLPTTKFNRLACHLRTVHKMTTRMFTLKHGSCTYGKSTHECLVCGIVMRHDVSLKQHFQNLHAITTKQYFQKLMEKYQKSIRHQEIRLPSKRVRDYPVAKHTDMEVNAPKHRRLQPIEEHEAAPVDQVTEEQQQPSYSKQAVLPPMTKKTALAAKSNETWYNGCVYHCDQCPRRFFCSSSLRNHLRVVHMASGVDKLKYLVKTALIRCRICGEMRPRDHKTLKPHLARHSMTIREYEVRFHPGLASEEEVGTTDDQSIGDSHVTPLDQGLDTKSNAQDIWKRRITGDIRQEGRRQDGYAPNNKQAKKEEEEKVWCRLCQVKLNLDLFASHLSEAHSLDCNQYFNMHSAKKG